MYRRIVVPLDGSANAEHALPAAATIARRCGAELRLVHVHHAEPLPAAARPRPGVHPPPRGEVDEDVCASEQGYLDDVAGRLGAHHRGTAADVELLYGLVAAEILRYASAADLVVMATHGAGGIERAWLGSVVDRVARESVVPVVLVRPGEGPADLGAEVPIERVLVPLDGGAVAEKVLTPAVTLAAAFGAGITLLHVLAPLGGVGPASAPMGAYLEPAGAVVAEAASYLERLADGLRAGGHDVNTVLETHPIPAQAILSEAERTPGSLVALATRGRGGAKRLLLGSVADKVVRAAVTPVLVFRPRGVRRSRSPVRIEALPSKSPDGLA